MDILLWDIDGTLIRSGGAGKAAMEGALRDAFALTELYDGVDYGGRTDPAIGADLLRAHGLEVCDAHMDRLQSAYLDRLGPALSEHGGRVLPRVPETLERFAGRADVATGLLTGNSRRGAEVKLRHFGLWHHFAFGGFGDGRLRRDDVARDALAAAARHTGADPDPARVWVIGDTPHDISCARAIGARAVAVATGWTPLDVLRACEPDAAFGSLDDAGDWFARWLD